MAGDAFATTFDKIKDTIMNNKIMVIAIIIVIILLVWFMLKKESMRDIEEQWGRIRGDTPGEAVYSPDPLEKDIQSDLFAAPSFSSSVEGLTDKELEKSM